MKLKAIKDIVGGEKSLIKAGEFFIETNVDRAKYLISIGKAEHVRNVEKLELKKKK